jgi:hypothetical protein
MSSPIRNAVSLTDEIKLIKIISAIRLLIRNYVSPNDMKRLSVLFTEQANNAVGTVNSVNLTSIRSERMMDFTSLYHKVVLNSIM